MKYDIIFADLDGTLLRNDKSIPENNIKAIKNAISEGVELVVCSGRSHMSLKNINRRLNIDDEEGYGIAFNGGTVFTRNPFKVIFEKKISAKISLDIIRFCKNYSAETMMYSENFLCIEKMTPDAISYSKNSILVPKKVKNLAKNCNKPINKIILIGDNNILSQAKSDFYNNEFSKYVDCFFSSDNLLEFNPKGISKGSAVKYIMNLEKFKNKKSLAIGDSYNDIPMFKVCDFSVACKNSDEEVKKEAMAVTECDNNLGLLSEVIEKYVL